MRAARLPGGAGAGSERCPRRAGRAAGALRGHTQARLLPPQLCWAAGGGRASAILIFLGRYAFLWETSVGGGGGRARRVAWWGAPPAPLGPCLAPCPAHLGDTAPGRCGGPAALLAMGGLPPTPPSPPGRGFCNAVGVVMHGAHRSPGPLQWQHRAGPLLAGSEGPRRAGPGQAAPLRSALEPSRLPAPGARERGSDAGTPQSSPSLLLAPRSAAWKCRCSARCVGKGE